MGIKQIYNDNLRKLPKEYGDVSVMVSWIAIERILLGDEHNLCGFFANIFDCNADIYTVFLRLLFTKRTTLNGLIKTTI